MVLTIRVLRSIRFHKKRFAYSTRKRISEYGKSAIQILKDFLFTLIKTVVWGGPFFIVVIEKCSGGVDTGASPVLRDNHAI